MSIIYHLRESPDNPGMIQVIVSEPKSLNIDWEGDQVREVAKKTDNIADQADEIMGKYALTDALVKDIADATPIFHNLLFHQRCHIWVGPPEGYKTTLAVHAAAELAQQGFKVWYVNLDAAAPDLKSYQQMASRDGYQLLAPLAEGTSEEDIVKVIYELADLGGDLSDYVLILDTLKKFTDVINKSRAKAFYKTLRELSRRGLTVLSLAHTNKYKDENGELVPEGTGDLKADTDIMTLLYNVPDSKGAVVSTESGSDKGGKARGNVIDMSFRVTKERECTPMEEHVDARSESALMQYEAENHEALTAAIDALKDGPMNAKALEAVIREAGLSHRKARALIEKLVGRRWQRQRLVEANNSWEYSLMSTPKPNGADQPWYREDDMSWCPEEV